MYNYYYIDIDMFPYIYTCIYIYIYITSIISLDTDDLKPTNVAVAGHLLTLTHAGHHLKLIEMGCSRTLPPNESDRPTVLSQF